MKVYIATSLENMNSHRSAHDQLKNLGHTLTYDWTTHGPVFPHGLQRVREVAEKEIAGVLEADAVIVLWPGGRGTHVELGAALAAKKRVFLFSAIPEHHTASPETCAFYHHPRVSLHYTMTDLWEKLERYADTPAFLEKVSKNSEGGLVQRLRNHARPDPHDERPVMHAGLLKEAANEIERLQGLLRDIGNYAHDHSTGPAVEDALWTVRRMAYEADRSDH